MTLVLLLLLGLLVLIASIAELVIDPLPWDWVGVAIGAALTAAASLFLWRGRPRG
jgi:hypothetical protein